MTRLEKTLCAVTGATLGEVQNFIKWQSTTVLDYNNKPENVSLVRDEFGAIVDLALNDVPVLKYLIENE